MEKIFYKPSKFTRKGEKFETPSGLGGTFNIEFVEKDADGNYRFLRKERGDWPAANYTFTEDQLKTEVFRLIPDKYDRLMLADEARKKYEELLANSDIDRTERY